MDQHVEYDDGKVIRMSAVRDVHNEIALFIMALLETYTALTGEGKVRYDPFVMKVIHEDKIRNPQPDIFVVTTPNLDKLTPTYMDGAADLVVEVTFLESFNRDRGEKFTIYEAVGVREYWIVDPIRQETSFYVRGEDGYFRQQPLDANGLYQSQVLPRLKFEAQILTQQPAAGVRTAVKLVEAMLGVE